jgi:ornithine--oxo-acid transaminase
MISNADCDWILNAFDSVIGGAHRVPGAMWSLGKTLAGHAMRANR